MQEVKLTIELSEQALNDLMDGLEEGIHNINPIYYRTKAIEEMYSKIAKAKYSNKSKISFRYKTDDSLKK